MTISYNGKTFTRLGYILVFIFLYLANSFVCFVKLIMSKYFQDKVNYLNTIMTFPENLHLVGELTLNIQLLEHQNCCYTNLKLK